VSKTTARSSGEIIEGRPVKKGDLLVRWSDGVIVEVLSFKNDPYYGRMARLKSRATGKVGLRNAADLRKAFYRAPSNTKATRY
jgi:hypothetical protein